MSATVAHASGSERCVCLFRVSASASEEQKGSGLFFGIESEPRTDDVKC